MIRAATLAASILTISAFTLFMPQATAQEAPDTEMSQYQFSGILNADNVYVRSGASENDYVVTKLSKGDPVVVVGQKFDWLKILPPEGTFCLVGKAWVDKRGDGSVGRVREGSENVNVRIASNLNNMITKVALQLKGGDDVRIVSDQDEYFRIVPPAGTYMYVNKKFVDPLKRVEVINDNDQLQVKAVETASAGTQANAATSDTPASTESGTPSVGEQTGAGTNVAIETGTTAEAQASAEPTTRPAAAVASAEQQFLGLEARFEEAAKLELNQRPVDELASSYQTLVDAGTLTEPSQKIAEFRVKALDLWKTAIVQASETEQMQQQIASQLKPIEAESQELAERVKANEIRRFTALGTLRPSALIYGGRPLYRLTDPASGRTVIYINSDDPNVIRHEGLFIGVRGSITEDDVKQIRFVQPNEVEQVDPTQIGTGRIASELIPPSLMPSARAE